MLKPDTRAQLTRVSTATLATALFRRGLRQQVIQGALPLSPPRQSMVGEAFTLRY
ncbi:MAG: ribonuclease activity regulator RraA, partial [Acidiphilium sp. 21-68-69]